MAEIVPFKGFLYDPDKVGGLKNVVTPPYDVIPVPDQEKFHEKHPNSVIRLILGKQFDTDNENDNRHTRAAEYCSQWIQDKVLVKDEVPALYFTMSEYEALGQTHTRCGITARIRIEPFEKGVILPHEKTYSKVKSERLGLMKACAANYSSVFSLFQDPDSAILNIMKNAVQDVTPDQDFTDHSGHGQKLWKVTDTETAAKVGAAMVDKKIFIADGHHRYETALAYRDWVAENDPAFDENHPANFIMMYLCSIADPGLIVLPAHRMLSDNGASNLMGFLEKAEKLFTIEKLPIEKKEELEVRLAQDASSHCLGLVLKGDTHIHVLNLKPGVMDERYENELAPALRSLDVTVLTRLIFNDLLELDSQRLDDENLMSYSSVVLSAVDTAVSGKCAASFILNPTRIEQVREIAETGLIMPRKTTYFYPKVITGQVINLLKP